VATTISWPGYVTTSSKKPLHDMHLADQATEIVQKLRVGAIGGLPPNSPLSLPE
jgi:hypothetical protein